MNSVQICFLFVSAHILVLESRISESKLRLYSSFWWSHTHSLSERFEFKCSLILILNRKVFEAELTWTNDLNVRDGVIASDHLFLTITTVQARLSLETRKFLKSWEVTHGEAQVRDGLKRGIRRGKIEAVEMDFVYLICWTRRKLGVCLASTPCSAPRSLTILFNAFSIDQSQDMARVSK